MTLDEAIQEFEFDCKIRHLSHKTIDNYKKQLRYDAAVSRYEATKAEREKVAAGIRQRGIRHREFERFISELEKLPEVVSEFDETLWGSLVDYVTVGKDKTMVFTLIGGTEIKN